MITLIAPMVPCLKGIQKYVPNLSVVHLSSNSIVFTNYYEIKIKILEQPKNMFYT